jgi:5-formyltetrahydrofolate cyclo-ligase
MPSAIPADLAQWRKSMRAELIARRRAVPLPVRRDWELSISLQLLRCLPLREGMTIGFCWPYQGEYDARPLLRQLRGRGLRCALPVVVQRAQPLIFRHWEPGVEMKKGPLGISYPASSRQVDPDILLIPLVGFGRAGDRLGYGGGYFDRTLASYAQRPLCIGIGFEILRIESTYPQPHDVPMDAIVTEKALRMPELGTPQEVGAPELRQHLANILQDRAELARATAHTIPAPTPPL